MSASMFFKNKVCMITGAGAGLGKALTKELLASGAKVIALDIQEALLLQLEKECYDSRLHLATYIGDVCDSEAMQNISEKIYQRFQQVDIVIANAGVGGINPADHFRLDIDQLTFKINYFGTSHTFLPFIKPMIAARSGQLVAISSLAAFRGLPQATSYCASKAAQKALMESWRIDLKGYGIKVNCIHPGFIKTAMAEHKVFDMPFMLTAEKAARLTLKAIEKNKQVFRFPLAMALASFFNLFIPTCLYTWLMPKIAKVKKQQPQIFGRPSN
jgi:short-subunit dehydrogenase